MASQQAQPPETPLRRSTNTTETSYGTITTGAASDTQEHEDARGSSSTERDRHIRRRSRSLKPTTLSLVNSGSVARDHLASERTFLAYVRTSLSISSMGVALVQLFRISPMTSGHWATHHFAEPVGAILILNGLLTLCIGFVRFFMVQNALLEGKFPASTVAVVLPALVLGLVIGVVFAVVVLTRMIHK